jgi:hypothetical protein
MRWQSVSDPMCGSIASAPAEVGPGHDFNALAYPTPLKRHSGRKREFPKLPNSAAPFVSVYDDKTCIGFIINRGRAGFEAFDADQNSLGTFPSEKDAANAISNSAKENPDAAARGQTSGFNPWQHLQANAAGTRLARQSASRPCRCTTSGRDDAMRSNLPAGPTVVTLAPTPPTAWLGLGDQRART